MRTSVLQAMVLTLLTALSTNARPSPTDIPSLPGTGSNSSDVDLAETDGMAPSSNAISNPNQGTGTTTPGTGVLNQTLPASPLPSGSASLHTCTPSNTTGVHPLNNQSCTLLLQTHLPKILNISKVGEWSTAMSYKWDLGGFNPGHPADECVVSLFATDTDPSSPGVSSFFAPALFLNKAASLVKACPNFGGEAPIGNITSPWTVKIATTVSTTTVGGTGAQGNGGQTIDSHYMGSSTSSGATDGGNGA